MIRRGMVLTVTVLGLVVFGAGCGGGDSTAPPTDTPITDQQAQDAGAAIAGQLGDLTDAFTLESASDLPFRKAARVASSIQALRGNLFVSRLLRDGLASDSCATLSDTTDTDGDGVPNDLLVSFDSPSCIRDSAGITASLSGSLRITDPGTTAGFNVQYTNVAFRLEAANGDYFQVGMSGTQGVAATTTTASLNENVTVTITTQSAGETASLTVAQNWQAGFTAAGGETFDADGVLPSGDLNVSGSSTWTSGANAFSFTMTTPTALAHDAACTEEPTLTAGVVRAAVVGNRGGAVVRVEFIGCGQDPVIQLVGATQ